MVCILLWNRTGELRHHESLRTTLVVASAISLCGNEMDLEVPPANDIMSGSSVTLRISLTNDLGTLLILCANKSFH